MGGIKGSLHRFTNGHLRGHFCERGTVLKEEDLRNNLSNDKITRLIIFVRYRQRIVIYAAINRMHLAHTIREHYKKQHYCCCDPGEQMCPQDGDDHSLHSPLDAFSGSMSFVAGFHEWRRTQHVQIESLVSTLRPPSNGQKCSNPRLAKYGSSRRMTSMKSITKH